jgi:hypothetical protein
MNLVTEERAHFLGAAAKDMGETRSLVRAARVCEHPKLQRNFRRQAKAFGKWVEANLAHVAELERGLL